MNQRTTLIAAVAVCATAGFVIGRISSESDKQKISAENSANTRSKPSDLHRMPQRDNARASAHIRSRKQGFASNASPIQGSITRMESIINQPDPLVRTEEWLRFIKSLDSGEIQEVVLELHRKGLASGQRSEFSMLLSVWATTNPAEALRWAEDEHEGSGANPWMVDVISGIAASDLKLANELLSAMPYSRERNKALGAVQGHYLKQGPQAARNWALNIEDIHLRAEAIGLTAVNLARTDPRGSADWLLANPSEASRRAISSVMERMAEQNPQAAISYLNSIRDPSLQASALEGLTGELAASDPLGALFVMDSNPIVLTDDVIQEFVWSARQRDPQLAASTIGRIENPQQRSHTYRRYISNWLRRNPIAAVNWVNQNEVPDDIHQFTEMMVERMHATNR